MLSRQVHYLPSCLSAGLAAGMEFKDRAWGGKWDWLDIAATLIGGLIGQAIQILILILIL